MKFLPFLMLILIFSFLCVGCTSNEKSTTPQTSLTTKTTSIPTTQKTTPPTTIPTTSPPPPTTKSITGPICDCSRDTYNCGDFPLPNGAGAYDCYNYCKSLGKGDVHNLDRDGDGRMCEQR